MKRLLSLLVLSSVFGCTHTIASRAYVAQKAVVKLYAQIKHDADAACSTIVDACVAAHDKTCAELLVCQTRRSSLLEGAREMSRQLGLIIQYAKVKP